MQVGAGAAVAALAAAGAHHADRQWALVGQRGQQVHSVLQRLCTMLMMRQQWMSTALVSPSLPASTPYRDLHRQPAPGTVGVHSTLQRWQEVCLLVGLSSRRQRRPDTLCGLRWRLHHPLSASRGQALGPRPRPPHGLSWAQRRLTHGEQWRASVCLRVCVARPTLSRHSRLPRQFRLALQLRQPNLHSVTFALILLHILQPRCLPALPRLAPLPPFQQMLLPLQCVPSSRSCSACLMMTSLLVTQAVQLVVQTMLQAVQHLGKQLLHVLTQAPQGRCHQRAAWYISHCCMWTSQPLALSNSSAAVLLSCRQPLLRLMP